MTSSLRILMLTCHPTIRGPFPKILPVLAEALRAQGCTVVTEPWGRHQEEESLFKKLVGRLGDLVRVRRRLGQESFDMLVLHTGTEWPNYSRDIPVLWLCRRLVRQVVVQFHGSTPGVVLGPGHGAFKKASRMLLRMCDAVLVLSSEEQRQWQQFHPQGRFLVTWNAFEPFRGNGDQGAVVPWKFPPGVPLLLYTGRLITEKGIFDLVEALVLLRARTPFHLLMAGNGPEEQALQARVRNLGLQEQVTMAGYLDNALLHQAYRAADLFVFPSWSEGFPTVITEAMDAGLPIVTTHIRGAVDHLKEMTHACFVPPRNPEKLAETIARVLADKNLRAQMSRANQAKVKEFAPDIVGKQYFGLLKAIAGMNSAGSTTE